MPPTATLNLEKLFSERNALVRQAKYTLLGRMTVAQTSRGSMDFKKQGPIIARLESGDLVVLSPWEELPMLRTPSEEFCPDCLVTCDECKGEKDRTCSACAGGGKLRIGGQVQDCMACDGKGKAPCATCRATGKKPSGYQIKRHGKIEVPTAAPCLSCHGTLRAGSDVKQDWHQFIHGRLGNYIVLAPISRFVIGSTGGKGEPAKVYEVLPDAEGNRLCFILEKPEPGSAVYLMGGILNPLSRAEKR